jgi:multidrug efflux pump subunit AcrA (membrane-fusion protein)
MRHDSIQQLADCTRFRQTLQARPPAILHGTLILVVALLGSALAWTALTRANLVVRGSGRVRPVTTPVKVFNAAHGEILSASAGGRVIEVNFRPGDVLERGDILVQLEVRRLDNQITEQRRAIHSGEDELARLNDLDALLDHQSISARAKAQAELDQAREHVRQAQQRQDADVRLAELELTTAERDETALRKLLERNAAPPLDLRKAGTVTLEAREKLARARLPIDGTHVAVLERALELVGPDHAVRRAELKLRREIRRTEVEAARAELRNLELQRQMATIRSPISGVVTTGDVKVGDILEPGRAFAEIAQRDGFRFEAAISSEDVGHLRVGMLARIKLDAYDYQRYGTLDGTVCFIAPDSELPAGQAVGVYTVRIQVPRDEVGHGTIRGRIKLGMTGQVEVVTGRQRLLILLARKIRQTISLG